VVKNLVRKISRILGAFLLLVSPALQFSLFITKVQAATTPAQALKTYNRLYGTKILLVSLTDKAILSVT